MGQPSRDRRWRGVLGVGAGLLALGVAVTAFIFITTPPHVLSLASLFGGELWSDLAPGGLLALLGWAALSEGRKRARRELQRARAMAGDEAAMIPVSVKPRGVAPADLEAGPLDLLWLPAATGVIATNEGLRAIRAGKERAFIPWSEARLLEVWKADRQEGFALAGGRALVEWRDYPVGREPTAVDDVSGEAIYLRAQTLLATVIARTALEPRACAPILTLEEQLDAPIVGWRSWLTAIIGYALALVIAGALLLTAASAPLAPLTHSLALNVYITLTVGGLGLALLIALAWGLVKQARGAPPAPTERPAIQLPAPPDTEATLRMRVLKVWRDNAILVGVLLLVAGEIYALIRIVTDSILTADVAPPWWDPPMLSVTILGLTSFIAGAIALAGLVSREPRSVLDEGGLRIERGARRIVIPWEMVAELVITVARGKVASYKVVAGDSQRTEIVWPDDVGLDGATPAPGEAPGALFAAAIAQRAGLTPRVVYK